MGEFVKVAQMSDLQPGIGRMIEVRGQEVALFNISGKVHAITNLCPHQGGPLSEGHLEGNTVICPWHNWSFDVATGVSPVNPRAKIQTFPVKVEGSDIYVSV